MFVSRCSQSDEVETSSTAYNVSSTAIKEKSWMSAQGQQLCANIDVYWMTPACTDESSGTMVKHAIHSRKSVIFLLSLSRSSITRSTFANLGCDIISFQYMSTETRLKFRFFSEHEFAKHLWFGY